LDFSGRGYILQQDILRNAVMEQLRISDKIMKEDVQLMFAVGNMFPARQDVEVGDGFRIPSGSISFDMFKKMFFPQLYLVKEE